jgi:predicted nucleic acid-binding protein
MPTATAADERPVVLLDTSAAIALVLEDHDAHAATIVAVRGYRLGLAGHAWFETYSVLTRLPGDLRRSPADAERLLAHNFPASAFFGETVASALGAEFARLGIAGGSVYDALVGAAARYHDRPLLTRDDRARPTYGALGVRLEAAATASSTSPGATNVAPGSDDLADL